MANERDLVTKGRGFPAILSRCSVCDEDSNSADQGAQRDDDVGFHAVEESAMWQLGMGLRRGHNMVLRGGHWCASDKSITGQEDRNLRAPKILNSASPRSPALLRLNLGLGD